MADRGEYKREEDEDDEEGLDETVRLTWQHDHDHLLYNILTSK